MCLYPKLIKNRRYVPNKKNGGVPPQCPDERLLYVTAACGKCMECRQQKQRQWLVRMSEELRQEPNAYFITLTIDDKSSCKFSTQAITDNGKYTNKDEYYTKRGGHVLNKLDRRMTGQHYSEKKFMYNDTFRNKKNKECRHSGWLNMMYPRLRLARDLLTDDGVIFISIGDEELFNLKKIADEIFGERNHVTNLIWQSTPGSNTGEEVKNVTENILLYCKDKSSCKFSTQAITENGKYTNKRSEERRVGKECRL